ncbi:hypothetical protein AC239_25780 [Bacteroides fragilis]|nr:hypothetical protein M074_2242 [Bacteroides fragilis str. DS-166]EXZ89848.1 hypothetical protein M068_1495 [Bacteroides fragilis str. J38-1]EYA43406.1 hypothetical protein M110_2728 [Bacteroides fragilis str. 3397 N3]OCR40629.1 hypothetical protein AC239_25780 [Bacteroides fragilis]OCR40951.1 hypothetical protein AC141_16230 [Bacteroides fragilis]
MKVYGMALFYLKRVRQNSPFMPFIVVATSCLAIYYFQAAGTAL